MSTSKLSLFTVCDRRTLVLVFNLRLLMLSESESYDLIFLLVGLEIVWFSRINSSSVSLQSGESKTVFTITEVNSYLQGLIEILKSLVCKRPSRLRLSTILLKVFLSISKDFCFSSSVLILCLTSNSATWPSWDCCTKLRQKI